MDDNNNSIITMLYDYKLHVTMLIVSLLSLFIGTIVIPVTDDFNIIILPLIPSLFLAIFLYLFKPIRWIKTNQSKTSTKLILLLICPLLAKLAIASGENIGLLLDIGPVLILKELGSLGTVFIGLPIALFLGFKRESIGMTSSICREPQLAVLVDKYGFDSDEVKGFFIVYLIGIVLGTIFVMFLVNILYYVLPLHPFSYALATGIGSSSMNVAAVSSLIALHPDISNQLLAFSGISNLISLVFGIYVYIFISLPLTERLYAKLQPYFK